jgi:phosphoglycolate phosphatase-like HAD superfamily hydrolase
VRDGEHTQVALLGHGLDALRDVAQGVDVEAGVDLVEDGELGFEHGELERLGPLLLASGELDVDAPLEELPRDPETGRLGVDPRRAAAVEDSHNGIRSAKAAGMRVVAIPNPAYPPDEEALAEADIVLNSITELAPESIE